MMIQPNSRSDYLSRQLISYIGNKRRLLSLIEGVLKDLYGSQVRGKRFIDPFAGSGVVSRLANTLGYQVFCNDWEYYAATINRCYLNYSPREAESAFVGSGGLLEFIEHLNHLPDPKPEETYFARYYAPRSRDPEKAVLGRERLFYTRENALILDKIRNEIDRHFPEKHYPIQRDLLLGPLLYLASKHTNTSGVFKAYHKGFGGYGKDALRRILFPIEMEAPVLWPGHEGNRIFQMDANRLIKDSEPCHILYLDPPYNQHQYGSNYHILNSLALWDRIPQPLDYNEKGELVRKAAIREDWVRTKSPYCRKDSAGEALADLIQNARAEYILISYSTDGIIPLEQMRDICESKGKVRLVSNEYPVYRGGRQSSSRQVRNIEFLWVIDPSRKNTGASRNHLSAQLLRKEIRLLCKGVFPVYRLKEKGQEKDGKIEIKRGNGMIQMDIPNPWTIKSLSLPKNLNLKELEGFRDLLVQTRFQFRGDEIRFLLEQILQSEDRKIIYPLILKALRKLAHPVTRESFIQLYKETRELEKSFPELDRFREERVRLKDIAIKRMGLNPLDLMESGH